MDSKRFVLDTNVLLADPNAIYSFDEHSVVIPIVVLEELDTFKTAKGELGHNARAVVRELDKLVKESQSGEAVQVNEAGGSLYIEAQDANYKFAMLPDCPDNYILGVTTDFMMDPAIETILVSKDINLRVKAKALGLNAQDYRNKHVRSVEGFGKVKTVSAKANSDYKMLSEEGRMQWGAIYEANGAPKENECMIVKSPDGNASVLARMSGGVVQRLSRRHERPCGVKPRNAEQRFLMDALMSPDIDCVICSGVAGTGKTLLSLACGIESMILKHYQNLLITKAIMPVGNDIGYVKGDKEDKMAEWLQPYYDNLDFLSMVASEKYAIGRMLQGGRIEIDALTYIRGRSLMSKFVIVDECQNLTPNQIKTVATRIADGSKLVLLGDLQQIDNPYVSSQDNGLAYAMSRFTGLENVAVMSLVKSERGRFATQAIQRL